MLAAISNLPLSIRTAHCVGWAPPASRCGSYTFFDNAVYVGHGHQLFRIDLDGTVTFLGITAVSESPISIITSTAVKLELFFDANTTTYFEFGESLKWTASGRVLKQWNLANIISAAMRAGGDDPSQFVYPTPTDWFHNNGVAYNRADDSLIVSSRENFLICLDYDTSAIKWILGDPTKKWYQFPSLRRFALTLAPGSLPPIGQHSPSITLRSGS